MRQTKSSRLQFTASIPSKGDQLNQLNPSPLTSIDSHSSGEATNSHENALLVVPSAQSRIRQILSSKEPTEAIRRNNLPVKRSECGFWAENVDEHHGVLVPKQQKGLAKDGSTSI